jgi:outer membrane protein assembly factor BamB
MLHLAALALVLASDPLPTPAVTGDWPQYNGARGDRIAPGPLAVKSFPSSGPPVAWRIELSDGLGSFAVHDGRAYTLVSRALDGTRHEVLIALDAATGKELWSATLTRPEYDGGGDSGTDENKGGDGPRSTPSVADGRVFAFDAELALHAFDAESGKPLWTRDLVSEFSGRSIRWQNAASPLVEGGLVLVAGGGPEESLLAFHADSGEVAWALGDETITHATPVAATLQGVRHVLFFVQSGIVAIEPESGRWLWNAEFPYRTSTAASPVVHDDIVYVSAGYGVGAAAWRVEKQGDVLAPVLLWRASNKLINHWSTPVAEDGHLYGMFSFKEYGTGPLKCVDLATGEARWEQAGFGPGNVILVGNVLVALSDAGELVLVAAEPDAYRELARADVLAGKCWSTPAFSDGALYLRSTREAVKVDLSGRGE